MGGLYIYFIFSRHMLHMECGGKNEMNNNMQFYGNNLNAPYGQNGYSHFFNGKNSYQQDAPSNNLLWVQGIEGAKALMLPPNSRIICLDSEIDNRAYIKISDELGATKLRKFNLIEITEEENTSTNLNEYVRKDELQKLIMELLPGGEEVIIDEQSVQPTQPATVRRVYTPVQQ